MFTLCLTKTAQNPLWKCIDSWNGRWKQVPEQTVFNTKLLGIARSRFSISMLKSTKMMDIKINVLDVKPGNDE